MSLLYLTWGDDSQTNPGLKLNGTTLASTVRQAMINNTRTLSPSKVNELRFAYSHLFNTTGPQLAFQRNVVAEYNMQGVVATTPSGYAPPGVAIGGCCSAGGAPGVFTNFNHTFQWVDNFSWVTGRHSFRFGGEIRRDRFNQIGNQFLSPQFNFDPLGTLNPASPAGTGFGFGDYLLGVVRQSQFALTAANAQFRSTSQYYYIDDTWKISPDFTLSLGLRYENTPPWVDRTRTMMNLSITDWAFGQSNVAASRHPVLVRAGSGDFYQGTFLRFDPAIQVARDGRLGDRLIRSDNNDFAPRLGLAWSPSSKWTFRTGVGIFYSQDQGNGRFDLSRNIAGRRQEIANPDFPNLSFDKPFAAPAGTVTISVPTIFSSALNRRTPYTMEWLLNIQREIGKDTALEIGYMGSGSRRLEYLMFQNKAVPAPLGSGSVVSRRSFPEFGNAQFVTNDANASYQALSAKITRRYSSGFTYLASYTFSRAIDMGSGIRVNANDGTFPQNNACLACERGLSTFQVPHRIAGSALYELPFGKGRAYLASNRFADAIVGGWQVSSLLTLQGGSPFTLRVGADQANTGRDDDRPSSTGVNANLARGKQDPQMWFDKTQFFPATYGTFGNVGRSTGVTAGIIAWDFSTLKNIHIHESHQLQFRFEAFNMPNHANFGMPDAIFSSATFARVTSTRTNMRSLQF
ncbi:MAG: TonB-dependent receptor, partial [Acidobacteria bacterium]|nr:TonB-dependent receptor [Acidobacteriota bacterium]